MEMHVNLKFEEKESTNYATEKDCNFHLLIRFQKKKEIEQF